MQVAQFNSQAKTCIALVFCKQFIPLFRRNILKHILSYWFVFITCFSFSQQDKTDSLQILLKTVKTDTSRINTLNALSTQLWRTGNYDTAFIYAEKAKQLANVILTENEVKTKSPVIKQAAQKGIANAYNNIGAIYDIQGNYPDALKNYFSSLEMWEGISLALSNSEDTSSSIWRETLIGIGASYNNVGIVYRKQGNYPEALKNYFAALKIFEKTGDRQRIAASYNNIGNIYDIQGNYPDALKNHYSSLQMRKVIGNKPGIAASYNNIGNIYMQQASAANHDSVEYKQQLYDKALKYNMASLKLKEESGNKQGIATSYTNIGNIYMEQASAAGQDSIAYRKQLYDKAFNSHLASLKIMEEIGDKEGIAASYSNIGAAKLKLINTVVRQNTNPGRQEATLNDEILQSKKYYEYALALSKEIGHKEYIKDSYSGLAQVDSVFGKRKMEEGRWKDAAEHFRNAYNNYKMYIIYRDSLLNEENTKKTVQLEMTYEFEKKEENAKAMQDKKDAVAAAERKKERVIRYSVIGGLVLMCIVALVILRTLWVTQKQKHLIAVKNAEITDSITYAKHLQQAILPPTEFIKKHLPESFLLYKPKDIVAGDFYWMESCAKDSDSDGEIVFIAAADSTGHGVPGAMVSVVCSNALNRTVKEFGLRDTGKILDKVTDLVIETFEKSDEQIKDGMDISLLKIERLSPLSFEEGEASLVPGVGRVRLQWSGANNPLWYFQGGEIKKITADRQPVGKYDNRKPFTTHKIENPGNSVFYLFTDGLPDQFGGPKGKKFMYKRFEENLAAISSLTMVGQQTILEKVFQDWKGSLEQVDDVTVIGIKI